MWEFPTSGRPALRNFVSGRAGRRQAVIGLCRQQTRGRWTGQSGRLGQSNDGIRVNAICPGVIDTPMFRRAVRIRENTIEEHVSAVQPIGQMGAPEEIAEVMAWLSSDSASLVAGSAMPVDGGYTTQ